MDKVTHFEVPADDLDRAQAFYQKVFGWNITDVPMSGDQPYRMINTVSSNEQGMPTEPGAINGGLMKRSTPEEQPVIVINVDDVAKKVEEAIAEGATVVLPVMEVMKMGLYARVKDTEGNIIGIWQSLERQGA